MNSRDYYNILHGWDVENYLTDGIRYCAIFIKLTEGLTDDLLVQYTNGTKRRVAGMFLFTDKQLALDWVAGRQAKEIEALQTQIKEMADAIDRVNQVYAGVICEEAQQAIET